MNLNDYLHLLSVLVFAPEEIRVQGLEYLQQIDQEQWSALSAIASAHHIVLRALTAPLDGPHPERAVELVMSEIRRTRLALSDLSEVCRVLEQRGCESVVIKSLDHWPDLGTDLDLLTCAPEAEVTKILNGEFGAAIESATWSDRVARKINYRLPRLPEFIEIHYCRLGQAGEQAALGREIIQRRCAVEIEGQHFFVPSPEDRIILAALQRLYRHFYLRLCDFVNTASLIDSGAVDFEKLRSTATQTRIWPGTATFLRLVSDYVSHYRKEPLVLPRRFTVAAKFGIEKMFASTGFLRLPLFPQGAELYLRQVAKALRQRDPAASARLGLIPPLAVVAALRFKLTGNKHGIW